MIEVVDYDAGNILSVMNALKKSGRSATLTSDPREIERASFVILPGVGEFGAAMRSLRKNGLDLALRERMERGGRTMGICLGLQLLFEESEESESECGLAFINGKVRKLRAGGLKVPHIGWTTVKSAAGVLAPFDGEFFYFVHSFAAEATDKSAVVATAEYGETFTAAVKKNNTFAVQFHPEKSGEKGLKLLDAVLKEGGV